jgi:hypothetical protein
MESMSSDFVFSAHGVNNLQQAKKPPDPKYPPQKISFRDKLLGPSQEIPIREKQDMIEKKLVRIELEDGNRLLPKIHIEPQVFQELCTPWKDALVVKLLGKNIGYNTMKERLQKIWKLQGGFEIMDNDNGFYMVKFDQAADKEKIITGGPWLIFDHCLAVTHWSPEFASPNAKVDRTVVWVRFPGLNLVYYDESFLLAMASAIGRPIKVDTNTLKVERGKFARVCVEVDLTVPVVGKIWVNGHWYKVQYEGLHLICTNCGCYGHLGRNCSLNPATTETQQMNHNIVANNRENNPKPAQQSTTTTTSQLQSLASSNNGNPFNASINAIQTETEKINSNNRENQELHGDWLLVTRRKKPQIQHPLSDKKTVTHKANKFSSLSAMTHQSKTDTANHKFPSRPKPNEVSRGIISYNESKRRRQEDTYYVPITKQSWPHPINKNNTSEATHTMRNTSPTSNPPMDPIIHDHVLQVQQTRPHTSQSSNPLIDQNSLTKQTSTPAQDIPILIPNSQSDMNDDSIENNDKNETKHGPTSSCEEDMVT